MGCYKCWSVLVGEIWGHYDRLIVAKPPSAFGVTVVHIKQAYDARVGTADADLTDHTWAARVLNQRSREL